MKTDPHNFNVGVLDGNHEHRRAAEDKLAKCFGLPDRMGVNKVKIYEYLWVEIANADESLVRRAIEVLRGLR